MKLIIPQDKTLLVSSNGDTVTSYSMGDQILAIKFFEEEVWCTRKDSRSIFIFDHAGNLQTVIDHPCTIQNVEVSVSSDLIWICSEDNCMHSFNSQKLLTNSTKISPEMIFLNLWTTANQLHVESCHEAIVCATTFVQKVWGGSVSGKICCWEMEGGKLCKTIQSYNKKVNCLKNWSGKLWSGSDDSIKIWNSEGNLISTLVTE